MMKQVAKLFVILGLAVVPARGWALQQAPPAADDAVSPAEIQRMFDSYALVQAQEQLKLGDDQFAQFFARFRSLQEVRRRVQNERNRRIQELRRLALDPKSDETPMKDQMKALQDLDVRGAAEIKRALDAVDQVLDVRQQARFRVFEELMERRKIDLVTRARQNNRLRGGPARGR
jgi:Spy/CpxP family protein refolding chaperone